MVVPGVFQELHTIRLIEDHRVNVVVVVVGDVVLDVKVNVNGTPMWEVDQ
jgi:hypothetical protein